MSFAEFIARTYPLKRQKPRRRRREGEFRRGDRVYYLHQQGDHGTVWQTHADGTIGVHWDVFGSEALARPIYHRDPASTLVLE